MTRPSGALRIFWYNWPVFLGTWAAALGLLLLLPALRFPWSLLPVLASGTAIAWSCASLLVSFYIYDKSALASGRWLLGLLGPQIRAWATVHAGLDAEVELDGMLPGECIARLDIYDRALMSSPSIGRARARTQLTRIATPCSPTELALADKSCDAIIVAFTAHEIRDRTARETFFVELRRALRPGGKALLLEHPRDWLNFLAFGPGFLHFVARHEWLRLASQASLRVASEARITPWVMALTLEKPQ